MGNFKGWTADQVSVVEARQTAARIDRKEAARKAKAAAPIPKRHGGIETTFVGVDPALRKGGFWVCIICRIEHTATFKACSHLGEFVQLLIDANPAAVIVENSNLQKNVFARNAHAGIGGALSVGKNMGVSQAAADIAQGFSCIPSGISPQQKGAKVVSEALFQSAVNAHGLTLVGYKKGTGIGQDQRDAFKLACIAEQQYRLYKKTLKQN